ncbi:MAG: hypothetical protein M3044_11135 [Thermoproteota archaeon]|nr:hypothetical protein [Thermoproteota archaeon]
MSTLPIIFKDPSELMAFTRDFIVRDRLNSLAKDIERCLPQKKLNEGEPSPAPFPALMYCLSIIDLLGALYSANARSGKTTENARKYMERFFLKYPQEKLTLLWQIYRQIHSILTGLEYTDVLGKQSRFPETKRVLIAFLNAVQKEMARLLVVCKRLN